MKLDRCVFCGSTDIHHHHVIPKGDKAAKEFGVSEEFINSDTNLITVCTVHHDMIHGIRKTANPKHFRQLVIDGQERARKEGRNPGRPRMTNEKKDLIYKLYDDGVSWDDIKEQTGCALSTISKCLRASGRELKRIKREYNRDYWKDQKDPNIDKWMADERERLKNRKKTDFSDMPLLFNDVIDDINDQKGIL